MPEPKTKKFRLSLVNAAEDVPRLVRAYGRACDGEFAMVLRPPEERGVLVLVTKKEGAFLWRAPSSPAETSDAPARPTSAITAADAVAVVKTEQKAVPKPGPITLRGQWSGWLHCDGGSPRVELVRKLAAYGVLRIVSGSEGWTWTVERTEKWFSRPGADTGTAATLVKAIEGGLARAMGLLGEACSVRDSRRRAALDTSYAVEHPIQPAREGTDPTERMKPKEPRARKAKAPPPAALEEPVSALPDVPATDAAVKRLADEVTAEADALSGLRGVRWAWSDTGVREEVAAWFGERGLDHLADDIRAYDGGPERPLDAFIDSLKADVRGEDAETEALTQLERLREGWLEAPVLMERARRLIRYATQLAESPMCRGKEKREAAEAIARAVEAYQAARTAITEGQPVDGLRTLRRIGERVALSAAKAARSCAAGQQSLTASAPAKPARAAKPGKEPRAPRAPKKPAVVERPPAAEKPKSARAPRSPVATEQRSAEVDAEKDKALLDAFSAAIAAAMKDVA